LANLFGNYSRSATARTLPRFPPKCRISSEPRYVALVQVSRFKIQFFTQAFIAIRSSGVFRAVRLILTERFDSITKIGEVHLPTLILHGEADRMNPPLSARRLYDAAPGPKQLALIAGGGHEDSAEVNPTAYFAALNGFLSHYGFKPVGGRRRSRPQGDSVSDVIKDHFR
jgi:pimeloyl-ACP methyl ester carboxylesterase